MMAEKRNLPTFEVLCAMRKNVETLLTPLCTGSPDISIVSSAIKAWAKKMATITQQLQRDLSLVIFKVYISNCTFQNKCLAHHDQKVARFEIFQL